MTTVISDTSPINYLVLIGEIEVLPKLFQKILIPPAVWRELQHPRTPPAVFAWAANLPEWVEVVGPLQLDSSLELDAGETEAISLAIERSIPVILMDDRQGWLAAEARSIAPVGTINLLELADTCGLLSFEDSTAKLRATNFRIDKNIVAAALERTRKRPT